MTLQLPVGYIEGKAAQAAAEARESFWAFRKILRYGTMLWGWWVELVAVELQQFYEDFVAGRNHPVNEGRLFEIGHPVQACRDPIS